ncbi:C40 family peptidase [Pseudomonas aeruginosa]
MSLVTRAGVLFSFSLLAACSGMQQPHESPIDGAVASRIEEPTKVAPGAQSQVSDPKDHSRLFGMQRKTAVLGKKVTTEKPKSPASEVIMEAIGLIGTPYRWGGTSPETGFDCSGLINHVYGDAIGVDLPRSSRDMAAMKDAKSVTRDKLKAGDLIFFSSRGKRIDHAAIYVGDNRFVHSPSRGGRVRLDSLAEAYWNRAYRSAKRVL